MLSVCGEDMYKYWGLEEENEQEATLLHLNVVNSRCMV